MPRRFAIPLAVISLMALIPSYMTTRTVPQLITGMRARDGYDLPALLLRMVDWLVPLQGHYWGEEFDSFAPMWRVIVILLIVLAVYAAARGIDTRTGAFPSFLLGTAAMLVAVAVADAIAVGWLVAADTKYPFYIVYVTTLNLWPSDVAFLGLWVCWIVGMLLSLTFWQVKLLARKSATVIEAPARLSQPGQIATAALLPLLALTVASDLGWLRSLFGVDAGTLIQSTVFPPLRLDPPASVADQLTHGAPPEITLGEWLWQNALAVVVLGLVWLLVRLLATGLPARGRIASVVVGVSGVTILAALLGTIAVNGARGLFTADDRWFEFIHDVPEAIRFGFCGLISAGLVLLARRLLHPNHQVPAPVAAEEVTEKEDDRGTTREQAQ